MKPINCLKLYWSGEMMLEFGVHAEDYKIKLLDDSRKKTDWI